MSSPNGESDSCSYTSYWLAFFRDAGLPDKIGTRYAVLFAGERVDPSMLSELSKDILRDMGITAMGDIIAILRHARTILDKNNEEKALGGMVRSTPAGRMIAHYVGNSPEKTTARTVDTPSQLQKTALDTSKSARRSVPDANVNYKVVLPKGTTPKTRAILEKMKTTKAAATQNSSMAADRTDTCSVFSRLTKHDIPKLMSTSPKSPAASSRLPATNPKFESSVFHRLGPRNSGMPGRPRDESYDSSSAEYRGVLKTTTGVKRRFGESPVATVTATSSTSGGPSFAKRARLSAGVVRAEATSTTHSEGIFGRSARRPAPQGSVHSRLGGAKELSVGTKHHGVLSANPPSSKVSQPFRVTGSAPVATDPLPPRRVTPEIEGRYKVVLPRGTTPKTRAILQKLRDARGQGASDLRNPIVWDL